MPLTMALPLAKLGLMALKIVTKPIANTVKSRAKSDERFKKICVKLGRSINSLTVWGNNLLLSRCVLYVFAIVIDAVSLLTLNCHPASCRTPKASSKHFVLNESAAIDRGADAVGEMAMFVLIGVPVVGVYWAEKRDKDAAKESSRLQKEVRCRSRWLFLLLFYLTKYL